MRERNVSKVMTTKEGVKMPKDASIPVVRLRNVSKKFPGVVAVDGVNLEIMPGEVHVVAGENGAGKSTLMKLLSQVERPTEGTIEVAGEPVEFRGPRYAQELGVAMVHQEFALASHLSVAENLFLGREPMRFGLVDRRTMRRRAEELLEKVGMKTDPDTLVSILTVAGQQRVEIAKAVDGKPKVVIMDEPTATLAEKEIEDLFAVIRDLTGRGIAILYISHKLDEIFRISDRVTVMRDGRIVDTLPTRELDEEKLVRLMVGREVGNLYPKPEVEIGEVVLKVSGISRGKVLQDCSFEVRAGEILGFAGLVGAGRTELARAVFGADRRDSGTLEIDGKEMKLKNPQQGICHGPLDLLLQLRGELDQFADTGRRPSQRERSTYLRPRPPPLGGPGRGPLPLPPTAAPLPSDGPAPSPFLRGDGGPVREQAGGLEQRRGTGRAPGW